MNKMVDQEHRVVRLSNPLRTAIRAARDRTGLTNEKFVATAIEKHLAALVAQLVQLGFSSNDCEMCPTRLPFSIQKGTLKTLAMASKATGVSTAQLLRICLNHECRRKATRRKSNGQKSRG